MKTEFILEGALKISDAVDIFETVVCGAIQSPYSFSAMSTSSLLVRNTGHYLTHEYTLSGRLKLDIVHDFESAQSLDLKALVAYCGRENHPIKQPGVFLTKKEGHYKAIVETLDAEKNTAVLHDLWGLLGARYILRPEMWAKK